MFDCRPDFLASAAVKAVAQGADTIDLNMGCPVNKITKNGGGSSLLRQPELAAQIVREVVNAVDVPVTVKTRIGWDDNGGEYGLVAAVRLFIMAHFSCGTQYCSRILFSS